MIQLDKNYVFLIAIALIFTFAVSLIVYGDMQENHIKEQALNNTNTSMASTHEPTFIAVPPNETDHLPQGSMKIVQIKKVETMH